MRNRNKFRRLSEKRREAALIGVETKRFYRRMGSDPDRIPETTKKRLPFTVTFDFGGDSVTFFPKSLRHIKRQTEAISLYSGDEIRYGGQERL